MSEVPTFNVVYGDKVGNILYLYQALLPIRKPGTHNPLSPL